MKTVISLALAAFAALWLAGCIENDVPHVGSVLTFQSATGPADDSVARKQMENRTF
jgi:hypothetical protein